MRLRVIFVLALTLLAVAAPGFAQQPGEIFGKAADASGAVMPGVTVTLSGPRLLQPMVATTSATGTYRFPGLGIGSYTVKFELAGFKTLIRDGVRVEIGANVQINAALEISTVQETVTVSGETPVVDLRDTSKTSRFTQETLQSIPSARDPWVIIEQAAGVAMDRQNVGGSASGQQSNFVARGAAMSQQKWNLDGIDITDMNATGGSPIYFDFDSFEEMQISAGGADVTMQSPGVGVNLVTKSGTDRLKGSGRYYITDDKFQSINVTDELRKQGAATGNPIQNIKDFGFEAGGPIKPGRAWFWGGIGKQNVNVGINNFFKDSPECLAQKASLAKDPTSVAIQDVRGCLNSDTTLLNNYNAKVGFETFKNNQFSMLFNAAEKVRNARDASDLRPLETTYRQVGVADESLGSKWWKTGMPKTYKWSDRHIFSDRFMVEGSYAHVGNNFALTFHDESLRDVQPLYETTTELWANSYQESVYVRPTDSIDLVSSYFLPGFAGGDHALKMGVKVRNDGALTRNQYGGNAYGRMTNGIPVEAQIYRLGYYNYSLHNRSVYIQDTYSRRKMTVILGLRYDHQTDAATPSEVPASDFYGKATFAGTYCSKPSDPKTCASYPGAPFNQLPALNFPGKDAGVPYKNFSPRFGLTYDLTGNGRNVVKFNYARYADQMGSGGLAGTYNTVSSKYVRYPWVDNGDKIIQANEVVLTPTPLSYTSGYNYKEPTQATTTGTIDPNLTAPVTDELLLSFDRQLSNDFAVSGSFIWRKYTNFNWQDTPNWTTANYKAVQWTPAATACASGTSCPAVTYYERTSQPPVEYVLTNQPGYSRGYRGVELSARKRMSKNWMLNASYSYNNAPVHYTADQGYEDPTNIMTSFSGGQYAPESTSSGLGNVFVNQKWIFRTSGAYTLPVWKIGVAATYNARGGNPYIRDVLSPTRPFSGGTTSVYLDKRGDARLPNFQNVDLRVDKPFAFFGRLKAIVSMDIFNLTNGSTTLSMRGRQNTADLTKTPPVTGNSNTISSLLAPRVIRFGVRATF
jgi:hypothetical protein